MDEVRSQPKMVGRERELERLKGRLDDALDGKGSTIFISGEAGIGKTRLVEETMEIAKARGFQVLSGYCRYESLTPYMPFLEALRSGGLEVLFAEVTPRVEGVYLTTESGLLVKEVLRKETKLNPNVFASMFSAVRNFIEDSLDSVDSHENQDTLNRIGYGDYTILVESGPNANLALTLTGRENEFLIDEMKETVRKVHRFYGDVLVNWDGEKERVEGIDAILQPLITSGKYDGVYYGKTDPKSRRNLLLENVSLGLMRQAQTTPTLLCIEDLQWADPSTLALMHYVARTTGKCGLLILSTYRPEDLRAENGKSHPLIETIQLMSREELHEKMELQRLSEESMVGVLSSLLGEVDLSDDFKDRIYRETEGNPLFIIELVKLMIDEEIIKTDNGTWKLVKNLEELSIPSKIYDVILRRLNRVERKERRVLDCASVAGEIFTSAILAAALNEKRIRLLERLRGLEQTHRLIHSYNGGYRFDHAKIKEVLYNEIPEELRMEYHSVIANSIEELCKDDIDEVIGDLAFHYHQCKNREKALLYLVKAAERAKKDYSNEEAIRFYAEALELEEDAQKRVGILEDLGDIYSLIGDYEKSIEAYVCTMELTEEKRKRAEVKTRIGAVYTRKGEYSNAMRVGTEALDIVKGEECREEALALNAIGSVHLSIGEYDRALEYHERSLEISEKIGDQESIAGSLRNIGNVHWSMGEYDRALEYYERSLEISEKIGDQESIAGSLRNIGNVHTVRGEYDRALEYYERSLEISEKIGNQQVIAVNLMNTGVVYSLMGEYDRALEYYERSLEISEKIGDQKSIAGTLNGIGAVHLDRGEYDRALEYYERSLEIKEKIGDQQGIGSSLNNIGTVHTQRGEYDRALEYYERSLEIKEKIGDQQGMARPLGNIGAVHTQRGEYDRALEYYERSLEISEKIGDREGSAETYYRIAEVHFEKRNLRRALDFCNRAFDLSREVGLKESEAVSRRIFGKIHREREKWKESIEDFEESIRIFEETGMKKELGDSNYEFGLMWKAKGDPVKAKKHLNKANEVFEKLNLERSRNKVRLTLKGL